jgi:hypothetical protein
LTQVIVSAEAGQRYGLESPLRILVQKGRDPIDGKIIRVLPVRTPRLQLAASGSMRCDTIRPEKGMQVGFGVATREDQRVDVLVKDGLVEVDLGVGEGRPGQQAGGDED